ncbi:MAG: thioredoxin TrxC [Actinomycetales bacterium]|nr:thioredoxin TrxC [Actinomycetales bacterium]
MSAPSVTACPSCGTRNRVPAAAAGTPKCAKCRAALPWVVAASDDDFDAVVNARVPVLVDLWAPWCGPCRTISPLLEKVARERAGSLKLVKVNVDNSPRTASRFNARSIPTMLMMKSGREVSRLVGAVPKAQLDSWVAGNTR